MVFSAEWQIFILNSFLNTFKAVLITTLFSQLILIQVGISKFIYSLLLNESFPVKSTANIYV